jgi:hypothetical protein
MKKEAKTETEIKPEIKTETKKEFSFMNLIKGRVEKEQNFEPKEIFKQYKINKNKGLLDFKGWRYKLMSKYHPLTTIKVNMELTNGETFPFVVKVIDGGFVFNEGFYILDEKYKYYDTNAKLWCFDYHEELCLPVDKKIKISEIKKTIYESGEIELESAINPVSLQKFMESNVIQKILAGAELEDSMRKMKMYLIITMIVSIVSLLLTAKSSGLFNF